MVKIQSASDIITNSSSEVFIAKIDDVKSFLDSYFYEILDMDFVKKNGYMLETVCELGGIEPSGLDWWDKDEDWFKTYFDAFINDHYEEINDFLKQGYVLATFDSPYSEDAMDEMEKVKKVALWRDHW